MDVMLILLVVTAALIGAIGQLLLKRGMSIIGEVTIGVMAKNFVLYLFTNPFIFFGLFLYGLSTVFYLTALSRGELSLIFPIISVSYIFAAIGAFFFFGEKISVVRWLGIITIVTGVFLIVKN